jgi:hypothetical protein
MKVSKCIREKTFFRNPKNLGRVELRLVGTGGSNPTSRHSALWPTTEAITAFNGFFNF